MAAKEIKRLLNLKNCLMASNIRKHFCFLKATAFVIGLVVLTGCGAGVNRNVALKEEFWQNKNQKITIATVKAPEPTVHKVGDQGSLLALAVNSMINQDFSKTVKNTDLNWYYDEVPANFVKRLKSSDMKAVAYHRALAGKDGKKENYANIVAETDGELLLTLELKAVGARRVYSGGIPMSGPEGYCVLVGELINPVDKKVLWHHETDVVQKVQGKWDQPPHFSNFNQALNVAIAEAKEEMLDSFFSGR